MNPNCLFLFVFLFLFHFANGFNYLVVSPLFAHSHATFMAKIADTLGEAGHNVTFLCPEVVEKFRDFKYVKYAQKVVYIEANEELKQMGKVMESGDFSKFWNHDSSIIETIPSYKYFTKLIDLGNKNVINNVSVLDTLKNEKYDVIIFEGFVSLAFAIKDYLKIPIALPVVSTTHSPPLSKAVGEPCSPSFTSELFTNYPDEMTFAERLTNTVAHILWNLMIEFPDAQRIGHPEEKFDQMSLYSESPFLFINSNPFIDYSRPIISKTILIGGINVNVEKLRSEKVSKDLEEILEKRPYNILISFGSLFLSKTMPESYKENIAKVMKSMKNVTFFWKYESDETSFAKDVPNVVFRKWFPQSALLADKRLSAFLTHGGLGSVNELSYLGVPAIICPLFADQIRNAKMLTRHNGSIEISKYDLANFQVLRDAFNRIIHDSTYKIQAGNLARQLEKQPFKPKELVIKYSEFAAEFGKLPNLDPPIRKMSFISYYLIDVITVLTISTLTLIFLIFQFLKFSLNYIFRKKAIKIE